MQVELEEVSLDSEAEEIANVTSIRTVLDTLRLMGSVEAWRLFDIHKNTRIFRVQIRVKIIFVLRPTVSIYVRDLKGLITLIFGPHP